MIVAVTGQMRSGTSAVAEALHRMGCPVAMHTPAPMPPTWRFDWEDSKLSARLMGRDVSSLWLRDYLPERWRHAQQCYDSTCITLKSPYLAFARNELEIVAEMLEIPLFWVVLHRPQIDVDCSMSQWEILEPDVNKEIAQILTDPDASAGRAECDRPRDTAGIRIFPEDSVAGDHPAAGAGHRPLRREPSFSPFGTLVDDGSFDETLLCVRFRSGCHNSDQKYLQNRPDTHGNLRFCRISARRHNTVLF